MTTTGTVKCRFCDFATPGGVRRSKGGKLRDGWERLEQHIARAHGEGTMNRNALLARGACDDRAYAGEDAKFIPEPGADPNDARRHS